LNAAQGGSRVIAQLVMQLAKRHSVALLYLRGSEDPAIDEEVVAVCDWVQEVERLDYGSTLLGRWQRRLYFLMGILLGRPMWAVEWDVPCFRAELVRRLQSWQPDIVQAEFHIMAQYLLALPTSAWSATGRHLLTMHEPGISAGPYLLGIYPIIGNFVHWFDSWAWRRYERTLLRQIRQVVVFSKEDRQIIESYGEPATVTTVQLGTQLPQVPLNPLGNLPPSVLFIGNFVHPPNVDAAQWLVQHIFPPVLKRVPTCQLYLVGNWPPEALRRTTNPRVTVTGYVSDIASYLDQAAVVVAPLRLGGGTRVKVLDALAAGKALVATSLALQGVPIVDGKHVVVADSAQEIADAVAYLLQNPTRRVALAQQARTWAEQHLGWEQAIQRYEAIYDKMMEQASLDEAARNVKTVN
jgi:glycosyltransferase involved in cell wall biosynthesis